MQHVQGNLPVPKLFNEFGSDSFKDQALIGGNPTGVANLNNVRYKWVAPLYRTMVGNYWIPQKINLTEDKTTVKSLTFDEDAAVKDTLSALIYMDNFQTSNLPNIADYLTNPAVKNLLVIQSFQEVIHSESYQYILESLYSNQERDGIYNRWRDNPALLERNKFIASIAEDFLASPTPDNFDRVIVANAILEGIYFYQGFNLFDQLAHRRKLVQSAKEIDYIRRDEKTHVGIFVNIIKERKIKESVVAEMVNQGVLNEISWCHTTYGDRILGISLQSSEDNVKYLGNDLMVRCGYKPLYEGVDNPYKHLEQANQEGSKRENFFESGGVTSYDTADSVEGWDLL